ncbi:unnamed protein product [Rotaria magnacalcarata]|uniref:C2H2-type domain-containing protein n=1 Tax=Rotaria magnacalcarata TaxID=392030 RepID=A0A816HGN2_9BILA|nr:unnamed protein product [Rotaria magnacalcarata]
MDNKHNNIPTLNGYNNNTTMNIDSRFDCLLESYTLCGGDPIVLRELLEKPAPDTNEFGSFLEYILFKGAAFNLHPTNVFEKNICLNHFKHLLSDEENKGRCKICKPICKNEKANTNAVRRVSKQHALAIWEYGHPQHWAFYDQSICDSCRKFLTANHMTDEIRSKCDRIFDWLYNKELVHTPASSEADDDDDNYEHHIDDQSYAQESNILNKIKQLLDEIGFMGRCESTLSYASLKERSKCNLRNQIKRIFLYLLKFLTPNDVPVVWNDIIKYELKTSTCEEINQKAMVAINIAIENAEHSSTKQQLLAVVAADFSPAILRAHFPTITDSQIKAARKHAYRSGRGAPVDLTRSTVERYTEQQVLHFLEFVLSPSVTADLPFGIRSIKMATGETIEIPNTCRNMIPTRIIRQYQNYCLETTNGEFQQLGFTSLMAILNACPASTRKSMAGIDDYSANGSTAFDSLSKLCDELSSYHVSIDEIVQLRKALQQSRNYIKLDYKLHVSTSSTVPDHCSTFALSDPEEQMWSKSCDHTHDDICQQCHLLDMTLVRFESLIKENSNISEENRIRLMKSFTRDSDLVQEWKKHQLRAVHQEAARDHVLESLDEESVNWAMKWLEKKYRQSQSDFYALRGLPWHLTHVVRLQPRHSSAKYSEKVFENRTFCHSFDSCIQNGASVVSILQDVFMRLKQQHPQIELAYVRSDNAGCYHGTDTLLAVKELYETTGILIHRIDFSEAQAGEVRRNVDEKHDCTTSTEFVAAAKSTHHLSILSCTLPTTKKTTIKNKWDGIKRYNNIEFTLKNDSTSNPPLITTTATASLSTAFTTFPSTPTTTRTRRSKTIISSVSTTPTSSSSMLPPLATTTTTTQNMFKKLPIDPEIKVWRAFGIGKGKNFRFSDFKPPDKIIPLVIDTETQHLNNEWKSEASLKDIGKSNHFVLATLASISFVEETSDDDDEYIDEHMISDNDDNQMDTSESHAGPANQNGFCMWECTHERCILQFRRRSDRDNHLDTGKHKFESNKVTLVEKAKIMYKSRLENDSIQRHVPLSNFTIIQDAGSLITTKKLHQGWGLPLKKVAKRFNFNQKSFMIDAYDKGEKQDMSYIKENGKFRFTPDEWLTAKQIKSFFSTLTHNRRKNVNMMVYQNTPNSQHVQSKEVELNTNDFKAISDVHSNINSNMGDGDSMDGVIVDSNYETDIDDEETDEEDFHLTISVMDMEDMLTTAKVILLPEETES